MSVLEIKNLHVSVEDKEILKGLNLTLKTGEIAAIMGPNGTGKSTLSAAIMGNPNYEITEGDILFDGESILDLEVDERARLGLSQVVRRNVTKFFSCLCWNLSLLFLTRLTQVLILMLLKWFQKGLTLCVVKALVL